jgi:radical SAM superfamily enzyme YgiQ (UPF0313 family)
MKKKKVVLFFPAYASNEACPPLALIAIAGPLVTEGYEVKIIDTAMEPDFVGAVLREVNDALCLGISLVTGPMIKGAIAVGRAVKAKYPGLPIILGGWHPSILPQQTLECPYVDAVVVKQGELTFLEIIKQLEAGASLTGVAGTLTKEKNVITLNPPRPHTPVSMLPSRMPGYDLIDYERYCRATGLRWLMYTTSHGCPYNCSYCSNAAVYGRNLDVLPVEQVIDEVSYLVNKYHIKLVGIIDDIFFAFRPRSLEMAEGFIRAGLKFEWYIQDRADSWERLTAAEARMFRRAGLGFIFGLPAEKEADLLQTVDLIRQIYERYDRADCYTNIFTPYPGSPAWQESIDRGLKPPKSFEEWADFYPRLTVLPWLNGGKHTRLQAIRQYIRFGYHQIKVGEQQHSWKHRLLLNAFQPSSQYRIRKHQFKFPIEVYSYWSLQRLKKDWLHAERF